MHVGSVSGIGLFFVRMREDGEMLVGTDSCESYGREIAGTMTGELTAEEETRVSTSFWSEGSIMHIHVCIEICFLPNAALL